MRSPSPPLILAAGQREILLTLSKSLTAPRREVVRAQALLLAADGIANTAIAGRLGVSPSSVVAWRQRFATDGVAKLGQVRPGRGRKPTIPAATIAEIVRLTQASTPEGETHWSCRSMAKAAGVSPATVQRVWSARGLKPHLVETFTLSNDKHFEEKLIDVVGLYLNPPDQAVVLCLDEKSQIQASPAPCLELPMKKGRAGTMTHDDQRNGTTTLFAALNVLTRVVIGRCLPRHRHGAFLTFLRRIDKEVPQGLHLHLILDNSATQKHANVAAWLDEHPRFHLHFTPTSSSWLNVVERWLQDLNDKAIRRGVFPSVPDLMAAIEKYLDARNADPQPFIWPDPQPFIWTATAEEILEKVRRGRVASDAIAG